MKYIVIGFLTAMVFGLVCHDMQVAVASAMGGLAIGSPCAMRRANILEEDENADQEEVRAAFLREAAIALIVFGPLAVIAALLVKA